MTELVLLALRTLTCPRCQAGPGVMCVTRSGRRASYVHAGRTNPILDAWRLGYAEGVDEVVSEVDRAEVIPDPVSRYHRSVRDRFRSTSSTP